MSLCVHVYMCVRVCVRAHARVCVRARVYVCICVHACVCMCICDWLWENPPVTHKDNYLEKHN